MAKKRAYGGGVRVAWFDAEQGECCEYQCQKRRGSKILPPDSCQAPADVVMRFNRDLATEEGGERVEHHELRLCKKHLLALTTSCIGVLSALTEE